MACLLPDNEVKRVSALASYDVLNAPTEPGLDALTHLSAKVAGTTFASIMLLDAETAWIRAATLDAPDSVARKDAICSHTILRPDDVLVVPDLVADPRFHDNPFVTDRGFRAYAGIPLINAEGHALGALCVLDDRARPFGPEMIETLRTLARAVTTQLELRRALRQADVAALTDPLTALPNRRTAMKTVEMLTQAGTPFTAIAVDLDFFKEVNDSEGHAAGDAVLQVVAERLRSEVRPRDVVARLGGDEFVVLLPEIGDRPTAALIAERVCTGLHRSLTFAGKQHRIGATLGVAQYPTDVSDGNQVLRLADEALMRAKRDKRGSIGFASREDARRLTTATAILRAFDASAERLGAIKNAIVHLQPIVTLPREHAPQRLLAVEALARWSHPSVGEVLPDELFSLIGPERAVWFGRSIREAAFSSFAALHRAGLGEARLAVNLSACEVMRFDTAALILSQAAEAGLSLSQIELEITEEVLLERVSTKTLDQLVALRGRGARLILDDFGTGTSGLAQLLRLPIDGLKLDKQFVQGLGINQRAEEIVKATISLAQSLKLDLVAEGVETAAQAAILSRFGCRQAQGYLFGRPMSEQALESWLRDHALSSSEIIIPLPSQA